MTVIALTIAGSDSGGGAGIQADLKTFSALGVFGASVVTAVTAQNTRGVTAIEDLSPGIVAAQIDAVLSDLAVGAIKIGMVSRTETIRAIAERLRAHGRCAVVDPVMVATSGDRLMREEAIEALRSELLPLADVATPNLHEAALLIDRPMASGEAEMEQQGRAILDFGARAVLVKGGHGTGSDSVDLLVRPERVERLSAPRVATRHDHGTGCTLAAAITAELARGSELRDATVRAKAYLTDALEAGMTLGVGSGRGPVHHFHRWWPASMLGDAP
ncbi:bifunctional hydroxymethylpyrimidine kinase/phosphomethylpyrimidine kinase [Aureimonas phyllosphaerae]|uniref:hydroxymethylpyrimidine kinase n=1 Tax=Aureimonas phyllosphaerae TaxID=1166078 RepID=A0A7W6BUC3_9HYPH|nr:bifunctional hydroxymethylpyrimidine kinase/phosphomethylpyrimidine kinase [Aureimonas phyllosphaerae]MBB3933896.1 hydroxymethylpyrimidine/phosphomethylpyrimidine kinase [Aureimonas phyllosphaerae]MBB3958888.1 hydroxymethylpyrimidine/phosphomethylpyrimidine kinase [Aureimonas phyllosphaerae]SFF20675.1 hydroxymethylpyrimidine kinase /phosphomethylpyrimidine kinase [Aureimonas phyllosphaerae]